MAVLLRFEPRKVNDQLVDYQMQILKVSNYAYGLTQATLPVLENPVDWYKDFNERLIGIRSDMSIWTQTILYDLTSVPKNVLNISNAMLQNIQGAITDAKILSTGDNELARIDLTQKLQILSSVLQNRVNNIDSLITNLDTFIQKCSQHKTDLTELVAKAEQSQASEKKEIDRLHKEVEELKRQVVADGFAIAGGVLATGAGIVIGILGIALAPVTGGGSLTLLLPAAVILGGGIAAITLGAINLEKHQAQIKADGDKISSLSRDVVKLKSITSDFQKFIDASDDIKQTLESIKDKWNKLNENLKHAIEDVNHAHEDEAAQKWDSVITDLEHAESDWKEIVKLAEQLQLPDINVNNQPVQVGETDAEVKAAIDGGKPLVITA